MQRENEELNAKWDQKTNIANKIRLEKWNREERAAMEEKLKKMDQENNGKIFKLKLRVQRLDRLLDEKDKEIKTLKQENIDYKKAQLQDKDSKPNTHRSKSLFGFFSS